jgi:hypothetical protein
MNTTIEVTSARLVIRTDDFGSNTLHRRADQRLWEWHEAVALAIADHHAQVMDHFFPCPNLASTQEEADTLWTLEASGSENDNAEGWLCFKGEGTAIHLVCESGGSLLERALEILDERSIPHAPYEELVQYFETENELYEPWSLYVDNHC